MKEQENDYIKEELKKFAQAMNDSYEKDNLIKDFCTVAEFEENEKEYIQIGRRINLPKEFFKKKEGVHKDNTSLAGDFIRSLVNGEKEFILREIISSKNMQASLISEFNYSELCKSILSLKNSTDIFLPLEPYFKKINYMAYESPEKIKFITGVGPVLIVGSREIKIHWITSHEEINRIIIINKNELRVIQKKFDDSENPRGIIPIKDYKEFSSKKRLMLYFGEKDKDNFDFIFRTILSKPDLNKDSALIIEVKNDSKN